MSKSKWHGLLWIVAALIAIATVTPTAHAQRRFSTPPAAGRTPQGTGRAVLGRSALASGGVRTSVSVDGLRRSRESAARWQTAARTAQSRGDLREAARAHREVAAARTEEAEHYEEIAHTFEGVAQGETGTRGAGEVRPQVTEHLLRAAEAHGRAGRAFESAANVNRSAGHRDSEARDRDNAGRAYRQSGNAYARIGNSQQAFVAFHTSANAHADGENVGMAVYSLEAAGNLIANEDPRAAGNDFMRAAGLAERAAVVAGNTSRPPVSVRSWHEESSRLYTAAARQFEHSGERMQSRAAHQAAAAQLQIARR